MPIPNRAGEASLCMEEALYFKRKWVENDLNAIFIYAYDFACCHPKNSNTE
ncbi:MAG: hypothetical protein NVS4B11_11920 [Ktedonobacteraceae bacterium]